MSATQATSATVVPCVFGLPGYLFTPRTRSSPRRWTAQLNLFCQRRAGVGIHRLFTCYFNEENCRGGPMTGKSRLPAGEPRKASQRRTRPAGTGFTRIMPQWRMGDRVRWQDKTGHFHRDLATAMPR